MLQRAGHRHHRHGLGAQDHSDDPSGGSSSPRHRYSAPLSRIGAKPNASRASTPGGTARPAACTRRLFSAAHDSTGAARRICDRTALAAGFLGFMAALFDSHRGKNANRAACGRVQRARAAARAWLQSTASHPWFPPAAAYRPPARSCITFSDYHKPRLAGGGLQAARGPRGSADAQRRRLRRVVCQRWISQVPGSRCALPVASWRPVAGAARENRSTTSWQVAR